MKDRAYRGRNLELARLIIKKGWHPEGVQSLRVAGPFGPHPDIVVTFDLIGAEIVVLIPFAEMPRELERWDDHIERSIRATVAPVPLKCDGSTYQGVRNWVPEPVRMRR